MNIKNINNNFFIFDANSIIFRGYYALFNNPIINSKGLNISSIIIFINFLFNFIKNENIKYISIVFDSNSKNFRKKKYPLYKSNRKKTPEELIICLNYIKHILKNLNISTFCIKGYEADDIIGTLSKKFEKEFSFIYIVTFDKDFIQLINKHIKVYIPKSRNKNNKILDIKDIYQKYKIKNPIQLIDILSIMGDKSDNIPGIRGIGEKKAKILIEKYENIENIIFNSNEFNEKLKKKIEKNKKLLILYKQLITIITDIPIKFNKKNFLLGMPNKNINNIFNFLEINKYIKNKYFF